MVEGSISHEAHEAHEAHEGREGQEEAAYFHAKARRRDEKFVRAEAQRRGGTEEDL
jgi:hypothetical protein